MKFQTMKLAELRAADYNPRKELQPGDLEYEKLRGSIEAFGCVEPVVWNKTTGHVIGGHQRIRVMTDLGYDECEVSVVELPLDREKKLNVALNKITGEWDEEKLCALLTEFVGDEDSGIALTGFDEDEVSSLLAGLGEMTESDGSIGEDKPPAGLIVDPEDRWNCLSVNECDVDEPEAPKRCSPGQIYTLGKHRLMCGDSTDKDAMRMLMDGETARMIFTDPPWNINYGGSNNPAWKRRTITNDNLPQDEFEAFLSRWAKAAAPYLRGDIYCVMGSYEWPAIDGVLRESGMHWSATVIWVKDSFVLSRSKYHRRYEPIWYGWPKSGTSSFCDRRDLDDVWEIPRPKRSDEHPTMKPVELVARAVENSSAEGDVVLDAFGGSGTTLIACEQLGRRCRMMEIDPHYCDVILHRWESLTGEQATLQNGNEFSCK